MENNGTTIVDWGYIGMMEKRTWKLLYTYIYYNRVAIGIM